MFVKEELFTCGCGAKVGRMQVHECAFVPAKFVL